MHIAVIGNFFHAWHKYAFAKLGITYDVYDLFNKKICKEINSKKYDWCMITNMWGEASHPYAAIKHKTVFWSSEDPNHFNTLKLKAIQCDYVFTTASECVQKYKTLAHNTRLCPDNVHVLQFAMVPELHSRDTDVPVIYDTVFIGNRYTNCAVRIEAEKAILFPILEMPRIGLHVYGHWDNIHGWKGLIPEHLFHGWVACDHTATVYSQSRVALSMNEQIDSPTMCSMRVFDIIGCGIPMLSYMSLATKNLFGDYVTFTNSPIETMDFLTSFFYNTKYRLACKEKAKEGREFALKHHTYMHRIQEMLGVLGYDKTQQCT